ncbi:MAG TPA: flagellar basal body P-ring formation chaperone FlgA [Planctomycetaceae bacterium]|nr:flagellar basal body P-ring formation chaperone FlgA [Planctomycetaceae bacterium]
MLIRAFITATLFLPLTAAAAVIDVRDRVTVGDGALVRLKNVARITDSDPIKAAALGEITLSPAPAAGRSQRMRFEDLRDRLQAHGVNLAEIEFRGQTVTTVTTTSPVPNRPTATPVPRIETPKPATKLQQQQADQLVQKAVQRAFRLNATEALPLRVTCDCEPDDVPLILATAAERIRFAEPQIQVGAPQAVTAHWEDASGTLQTVVVQVSVDLAPRRLAVRHAIPSGYPLQPDDLEWVTGDVELNAVTQLSDAVGKEATRTLRAGQVLEAEMLATVPLVRANDIVTMQVRRPGVTVRRMFKASSAGALNDTVTLVAVDDPRLRVQAVVTGFHEATMIDVAAGSNHSRGGGRQ